MIDPAANIDGIQDIMISNDRIAVQSLEYDKNDVQIIDAAGCLVLPGLVDFHTHLGYQLSDFGLNPDLYTLPNGITAAIDAGSGGTANFEGMYYHVFAKSMIDIKCFLNVSAAGIITERYIENLEPERYDVQKMEYLIHKFPEEIIGLKVRIGENTAGRLELQPLLKAVELGEQFDRRICLHATNLTSGYDKIIPLMRAGDIICHIFQGDNENTVLDEHNKVTDSIWEGRKKGIIFDCACGRVNYSNKVMHNAFVDGFKPDIISTDIIGFSIYGPKIHSLLSVMSHYYGMGMDLKEIVKAVTSTPAKIMGMENKIGTLRPGANADLCILKLEEGNLDITDKFGTNVHLNRILVPKMTFKEGKIAYRSISFNPF